MSKYHYILDAGHGGIINGVYQTAGKRSPLWNDGRQLFEGEFNRDVVKRLATLLCKHYIDHTILFDTEKDMRLRDRVNKINMIWGYRQDIVLVSIHANAGGGTGFEVFTSIGQTKSDLFATVFYKEMKRDFQELRGRQDFLDGDPDKEANFYVLKRTKCPAILVECAFMDRLKPDCELLMSDKGRNRFAKSFLKAIRKCETIP